jgi:hypothetical protein
VQHRIFLIDPKLFGDILAGQLTREMKHLCSDFHSRRLNDLGGVLHTEHVS